jgi:hypothetical protein
MLIDSQYLWGPTNKEEKLLKQHKLRDCLAHKSCFKKVEEFSDKNEKQFLLSW